MDSHARGMTHQHSIKGGGGGGEKGGDGEEGWRREGEGRDGGVEEEK